MTNLIKWGENIHEHGMSLNTVVFTLISGGMAFHNYYSVHWFNYITCQRFILLMLKYEEYQNKKIITSLERGFMNGQLYK